MKNQNLFVALSLIGVVLISSCNTNLSIVKRKSNKGFYVSLNHQKNKNADTEKQEKGITKTTESSINKLEFIDEEILAQSNDDLNILPASTQPNQKHSIERTIPKVKTNKVQQNASEIKQIFKKENKRVLRPESGGLSLLWLVIVIILILWLFGFLAGGWGMGGMINLLLLVALILLILWLLRII
jgi:hypothetical protein